MAVGHAQRSAGVVADTAVFAFAVGQRQMIGSERVAREAGLNFMAGALHAVPGARKAYERTQASAMRGRFVTGIAQPEAEAQAGKAEGLWHEKARGYVHIGAAVR